MYKFHYGGFYVYRVCLGLFIGTTLLVIPFTVAATLVEYEYIGDDFTNFDPGFNRLRLTGNILIDDSLLGGSIANKTFTYTRPGGGVENNVFVDWSFSDGFETFNISNTGDGNFLGFATDAAGNIVNWYVAVGSGPYFMTSFSSDASSQWDPLFTNLVNNTSGNPVGDYTNDNSNFSAWNTSQGTWSRVNATVPEPTTLTLMFLVIAVLVFLRRYHMGIQVR